MKKENLIYGVVSKESYLEYIEGEKLKKKSETRFEYSITLLASASMCISYLFIPSDVIPIQYVVLAILMISIFLIISAFSNYDTEAERSERYINGQFKADEVITINDVLGVLESKLLSSSNTNRGLGKELKLDTSISDEDKTEPVIEKRIALYNEADPSELLITINYKVYNEDAEDNLWALDSELVSKSELEDLVR